MMKAKTSKTKPMSKSEDGTPPEGAPPEGSGEPHVAIDFATFVMSLAASALINLGEHEDDQGKHQVNLPLARQSIEILGMLREKTRGNLTAEEQSTLEHVLYDLRLRFLKHQRS
jgi:hypothetical protein